MSVILGNWEYGSDFHWLPHITGHSANELPSELRLFSSGRGALKALLYHGIERCGWKRLWVPTYFCEGVTEAMAKTGIELSFYHDLPVLLKPNFRLDDFRQGDVVLLMNYFGLREKIDFQLLRERGVFIIEDHSHAPWSEWATTSEADYCIASLRKTLPIPDGGMLWSPVGYELPEKPKRRSQDSYAAMDKLCGMLLKSMYLDGLRIDKRHFLELIKNGENSIGLGKPAAPSPVLEVFLNAFPISKWDRMRKNNYQLFCDSISDAEGICFDTLKPVNSNQIPFNIVLVFSHKKLRDAVREYLIEQRVYSVILWEISKHEWSKEFNQERDFSERMLAIPCDGRYKNEDILRVSDILKSAIK